MYEFFEGVGEFNFDLEERACEFVQDGGARVFAFMDGLCLFLDFTWAEGEAGDGFAEEG